MSTLVESLKAAAVPALLFAALTPGVLVTIPSDTQQQTATWPVIVHTIVFLFALAGLLMLFSTKSTYDIYEKGAARAGEYYKRLKTPTEQAAIAGGQDGARFMSVF
jgi:hypothetical protein